MLLTSLNEIKSFNPCILGWKNVLKGQGKVQADAVEFSLVVCVDSNSISDVLWFLGQRKKEIKIPVDFANWCADSVKHLGNYYATKAAEAAANAAYYADTANYAEAAANAAYYADTANYAKEANAIRQQKEKLKELILNFKL